MFASALQTLEQTTLNMIDGCIQTISLIFSDLLILYNIWMLLLEAEMPYYLQ
jgi:hypothetical protein